MNILLGIVNDGSQLGWGLLFYIVITAVCWYQIIPASRTGSTVTRDGVTTNLPPIKWYKQTWFYIWVVFTVLYFGLFHLPINADYA